MNECTIDSDFDGLDDMDELMRATNAFIVDGDGDTFSDFDEVELLSDPRRRLSSPEDLLVPGRCNDSIDNDRDGRTDIADTGCRDRDGDGISDGRDNCLTARNPEQIDADGDGAGAPCDSDDDDDGVLDVVDGSLVTPLGWSVDAQGRPNDPDVDGVCDPGTIGTVCFGSDNCPVTFNPDQNDSDGDGVGDACDPNP